MLKRNCSIWLVRRGCCCGRICFKEAIKYCPMAKFIHLLGEEAEFVQEKYLKHQDVEENRVFEHQKAAVIQGWIRGIHTRRCIRTLHDCAITIQRHWRGFLGRRYVIMFIRNSLKVIRMNFYNRMATRIQKTWRGFFFRKCFHNFNARKRYLNALVLKNYRVRSDLDEIQEQLDSDRKHREHKVLEKKLNHYAQKHHYLVSTYQNPGIYNSPYWICPHPREMECRLKAVKHLEHGKRKNHAFRIVSDRKGADLKPHPPWKKLPPIRTVRVQGPFKSPEDVHKQRYKPLNPLTQTAANYNSLEEARQLAKWVEWRNQVANVSFLPFSIPEAPYEPRMATDSKYESISYGTKHFRETDTSKNISKKPMQTVVSPIPVFDKFEQTYTKGAVLLH